MQLLDYLDVDKIQRFRPLFEGSDADRVHRSVRRGLRENRSVLEFIHADYVIVNERLALHYGISDVYGTDFQKVNLHSKDVRGGSLRNRACWP